MSHQEQSPTNPNAAREGLSRNRALALGTAVAIAAGVGGLESIETKERLEPTPVVDVVDSSSQSIDEQVQVILNGEVVNSYEQDFQTEQTDANDSNQEVHNFVETYSDLLSHPEKIDRVSIIGLASAEDEQINDEQLISESANNQVLAGQRGELARQALVDEVKAQTGVDISDKIELGAREDMLTQEEYLQVTDMVTQFGYDSVEDMVNAYNRGVNVPPAVGELLDEVLASQRGAEITIELHDGSKIKLPPSGKGGERAKNGTVLVPERYEGYIPEDENAVVLEPVLFPTIRPGERFTRARKDNFKSRTHQVKPRIRQPRAGNTSVRNRSMSMSKQSRGHKGGHGIHSARGHRG